MHVKAFKFIPHKSQSSLKYSTLPMFLGQILQCFARPCLLHLASRYLNVNPRFKEKDAVIAPKAS